MKPPRTAKFKITGRRNGRQCVHYFATLEAACKAASDYFRRTGIVVGIEAVK